MKTPERSRTSRAVYFTDGTDSITSTADAGGKNRGWHKANFRRWEMNIWHGNQNSILRRKIILNQLENLFYVISSLTSNTAGTKHTGIHFHVGHVRFFIPISSETLVSQSVSQSVTFRWCDNLSSFQFLNSSKLLKIATFHKTSSSRWESLELQGTLVLLWVFSQFLYTIHNVEYILL